MIVETPRSEPGAQGRAMPHGSVPSAPAPRPGVTRPTERSRGPAGAVRPGGRRPGPELPAVRPRVGAGRWPAGAASVPPSVIRRRRRVAVLTLGLMLAVLTILAVSLAHGGAPAGDVPPTTTTTTVVGSGESLTDVARRAAPAADTTATVERIRELNALSSSGVTSGRPLVVPAG